MVYVLEPLRADHTRDAFCCGKSSIIDSFCKDDALDHHQRDLTRVKVVVEEGSVVVVAFHAMAAATLKEARLGYFFGGGTEVPAVRLEMFAAAEGHQRGAISTVLMRDVFATAVEVADRVGACCLCLDAANDRLADYYSENFDFQRISARKLGMFIPIATVRDALAPDENEALEGAA